MSTIMGFPVIQVNGVLSVTSVSSDHWCLRREKMRGSSVYANYKCVRVVGLCSWILYQDQSVLILEEIRNNSLLSPPIICALFLLDGIFLVV